MIRVNKNLLAALFMVLVVAAYGCKGKTDAQTSIDNIRTGTEGISLSFLQNSPPDTIHVENGDDAALNSFDVVLDIRNKGAYPQPDEGGAPQGRVFLSGYDANIIQFANAPMEDIVGKALEGKSTINPNGGLDLITFKAKVVSASLNVEKYNPALQATACYIYHTVAGPSVCIDPIPYSPTNEKKVCQVNSVQLSNQGAPIAITKIDEEALATKTRFGITIKNVGSGDVVQKEMLGKCSPAQQLSRDDIDKVTLAAATVGTTNLYCGPFVTGSGGSTRGTEGGDIRLINGEGFAVCELSKENYANAQSAYTSPIKIDLAYAYRTTIQKSILIRKDTSSNGASSVNAGSYTPSSSTGQSRVFPQDSSTGP